MKHRLAPNRTGGPAVAVSVSKRTELPGGAGPYAPDVTAGG
jgi:hypothetical protein